MYDKKVKTQNPKNLSTLTTAQIEERVIELEDGISNNHFYKKVFISDLEELKCELKRRKLADEWERQKIKTEQLPNYAEAKGVIECKTINTLSEPKGNK